VIAAACLAAAVAIEGPFAVNVVHIPVHLTERLSSQDAKTGDTFGFDTSSSAEVEGLFLPAGTHGHGVVVLAKPARGPQPGVLTLEVRTIDLPDGKTLAVGLDVGQLDRQIQGDVRRYPGSSAGGVPFSIGGSRETNVVYDKGTKFTVVAPPQPTPAPTETG
jgi:hypothetical protein